MKTNKYGNVRKPNRNRLHKYIINITDGSITINKTQVDDDDKIIQVGPYLYLPDGTKYCIATYIMVGQYTLNTITPKIVDIYLDDTTTEMLHSGEYIIVTSRSEKRVIKDLKKYIKRCRGGYKDKVLRMNCEVERIVNDIKEDIRHYNYIIQHYSNIINAVEIK